jgi:hypothetical protein
MYLYAAAKPAGVCKDFREDIQIFESIARRIP